MRRPEASTRKRTSHNNWMRDPTTEVINVNRNTSIGVKVRGKNHPTTYILPKCETFGEIASFLILFSSSC